MKRKTLRVSVITLCLILSMTIGFTSSVNVKADEEVKIYETKIVADDKEKKETNNLEDTNIEEDKSLNNEEVTGNLDDSELNSDAIHKENNPSNIEENPKTPVEFELKSNEALVGSFDEFRTLVLKKGNGVIDTYYMTDDFIADKGISVPAGYGFTLDGTNPYTNETHTYTQTVAANAAYSFSVNSSGTAARTIEYRNMNIVGTSKKGIIYSFSDTTTQIFDNVTFNGPVLSYNIAGKTIYKDSTLTNTVADYSSYLHSGKQLELAGETNVYGAGPKASYVFYLTGGVMTVAENANVTIEHSTRVAVMDSFEMKSGSTLTINGKYIEGGNALINTLDAKAFTMNQATLNLNGDKGMRGSAAIYSNEIQIDNSTLNFNVDSQSDILRAANRIELKNTELNLEANYIGFGYINATEPGSTVLLENSVVNESVVNMAGAAVEAKKLVKLDNSIINSEMDILRSTYMRSGDTIEISNKSEFNMTTNGIQNSVVNATNEVNLNNSIFNLTIKDRAATAKNQELITTKNVEMKGSKLDFYINDNEIKHIFNASERIVFEDSEQNPGELKIRSEWPISLSKNVNAKIKFETQQINASREKTDIDYTYMIRKNDYEKGIMEFTLDKVGNPTFIQNDFVSGEFTNFNDLKSLSMGTVRLHYNADVTQNLISFNTNALSNVTFTYNEVLQEEVISDLDGNASVVTDIKIKPGFHELKIVSDGLIRTDIIDFSSFGTVTLLNYPELLDFESLNIPVGHTEYQSRNQSNITVEDTRVERTGWKLEVRMKTPLHQQNNKSNEFANALIFRNPINKEKNILNSKPLLVYETDELYDEKVNIEFGEMEGILLEFYGANGIYADTGYDASLEWVLTQY
ncbi:MAG: hypothetical protein RR565_07125 [Erysipelothrix sp.]